MRLVYIWLSFLSLMFGVSVAIFAFTPVFGMLLETFTTAWGTFSFSTDATTAFTSIVGYLRNVWVWVLGILIFGLIVWAVLSTQQTEQVSQRF